MEESGYAIRRAVRGVLKADDLLKGRAIAYQAPTINARTPFLDFSVQADTPNDVLSGLAWRLIRVAVWVVGDAESGLVEDSISPLLKRVYELFVGVEFLQATMTALNEILHPMGWDAMMPTEGPALPMQSFTLKDKNRQRWREGKQFDFRIQPYVE